jgi:hypothetical protein
LTDNAPRVKEAEVALRDFENAILELRNNSYLASARD